MVALLSTFMITWPCCRVIRRMIAFISILSFISVEFVHG
ncbi:hypothetical protein yfred0001_23720 [Yersinia frederiksenii ATCC 33641]|nr:hypothetical protein yfred0001_23720 [Yersinia frederiksenii ATCC 33641]